jgi:hypothetical protein
MHANTRCCFSSGKKQLGHTRTHTKQTNIRTFKDAADLAANIDTQRDRQRAADVAAVTPHKLHIGKKHTLLI